MSRNSFAPYVCVSRSEGSQSFEQCDFDVQRYVQRIRRFFGKADGPTTVEYAVMLALIMLTAVSGARTMGCSVNNTLNETAESLGQ
jgi:Flp pilus assembly pilin Flp